MSRLRLLLILPLLALLQGCNAVVMAPSGDIAIQQRDLIVIATILMLIVIVPVMIMTVYFAWKYRAKRNARYEPDWDHSMLLELAIWGAPLLIIIFLGGVTWMATHRLDPYRPLDRVSADKSLDPSVEPLEIQAVAMDWKWLFIYPQYGIATINEIAAPVDRPITFSLTSSTVMNSFYIPALAGQIYAMAGMETKLHAVINERGVYDGFSANYSGHGFSGMRFKFHGDSNEDFDAWVAKVKSGETKLDHAEYEEVEEPSQNVRPTYFSGVDDSLYHDIMNMCVDPDKLCMDEVMMIDQMGGLGVDGLKNLNELEYDKYGRRGGAYESEEHAEADDASDAENSTH